MKDTICAIATLVGESSINVIRVSGDASIEIVNKIFDRDLTKKESNTISYGFIMDNNEKVDEVLVSVFRSPKSFTTEDIVEINTHGGKVCVNKIMELLLCNGARLAEPGEFTKRAFLNGRIDLIEADGIMNLISSKTENSRIIDYGNGTEDGLKSLSEILGISTVEKSEEKSTNVKYSVIIGQNYKIKK